MRRVPQPRPMSALEGGRTVYDAMLESKQYQEALAMYQTVHASHARLVERMREEKKRTHMARVQTRRAELRDTLHARQATARQAALSRQEFFPLRQTQRAIVLCKRLHESMSPSARPFTPRAAAATTASAGGDAAASATCAAAATPTAAAPAAAASPPRLRINERAWAVAVAASHHKKPSERAPRRTPPP